MGSDERRREAPECGRGDERQLVLAETAEQRGQIGPESVDFLEMRRR
jgi:hypothetical protein